MSYTLNGARVRSARVTVGAVGPWVAEVELENDETVTGAATLELGTLTLSGTVEHQGTYGAVRTLRVVAGAGAWGRTVPARGYHNDFGVRAASVAADAAQACGETLGAFLPRAERLGADYVRQSGPAVRALEAAAGGADWWVGYDGTTQVGVRPASTPSAASYEVKAYDPLTRRAVLWVDADLGAVQIGAELTRGLDAPLVVRELEITVTPEDARVTVWGGEGRGALAQALKTAVTRIMDAKLAHVYRYRVLRLSADRVELQPVRSAPGLPDLLPVSMCPGLAGAHATLQLGAEVLVQFVEGDPTMPVITSFAGRDGQGHVPTALEICTPGLPAARQGDPVQVTLPPAAFSGTIGGSPATGTVTWAPPATANGTITGGSAKVRIG